MATDRDEQQRQQQELEEIRRSFAEMGARMGSLFEPAELDEPERAGPGLPAPPAKAPAPSAVPARPRWWWVAGLVLLFLAGTAFGSLLTREQGGGSDTPPAQATNATIAKPPVTEPETTSPPRTRTSVPESCMDTAELADEVISRLTVNQRDQRLAEMFRDYTIASQACRREASP